MTTLSLTSSADRPLSLTMRPDLSVSRQSYQGKIYWILKDPLALKYYRFENEEFAILQMLDGQSSLSQIKRQFEREFAPQRIEMRHLHQLLGMFHQNCLIVADDADQGQFLLERRRAAESKKRNAMLFNLLSFRFRGIDPDRFLTAVSPFTNWLFSLPTLITCVMLALVAALLFGSRSDQLLTRLPALGDFFATDNWLPLALTLAITKIIHELGHGLACKRFGGSSHEMGLMLLVFTPCLYCNVSDAWMVPSRWRRAAIGAAGMYLELIVATAAAYLWLFTQPGVINMLCLNVIFVCSLSTLAFNANPLMRFDGYYILSDLLEIPNLRQKATAALSRKLADLFLGLPSRPDPFLPRKHRSLFALYAVAAGVYRWVIVFSITWMLIRVFRPYGLQIIGQALAGVSIVGLVAMPLIKLRKFFQSPGRVRQVNKLRLACASTLVVVLLYAVGTLPLPHRVVCPVELRPREAATVYIDTPGELTHISVRPGQSIAAGQPLVQLYNEELLLAIEQLEGQRQQLLVELDSLHRLELLDSTAASQQEAVREKLHTTGESLATRRAELERLSLAAPRGGVVLSSMRREQEPSPRRLGTWDGEPLDIRNLGATLQRGTMLCQISDPSQYSAVLMIDQADMEFVQPGQTVSMRLACLPDRTLSSSITNISQEEIKNEQAEKELPAEAAAAEFVTTYQAKASVEDRQRLLYAGATGWAKIEVGQQTLAAKLWRWALQTFRFSL